MEVTLASKSAMSEMMGRRKSPLDGYQFHLIGLAPSREELKRRIEARVEDMFAAGLVDEVRSLLKSYGPHVPAFKAIGYREAAKHISGELGLAEARQLTVKATVQYAKRQMTWFRREEGVVWFEKFGDAPEMEQMVREHLRAVFSRSCQVGEETLYAKTAP
jgi:tRNA dimethylallyltransferase